MNDARLPPISKNRTPDPSSFDSILSYENLRLATYKALAGKRSKPDARDFVADLEANLRQLRDEVAAGTVKLGECHQFTIYDPKERVITAPCFRERVLHHALMNLCEPVLERWLISDTFACRQGRGRIAALHRARQFAYQFPYYCQMDIRKYFPSIDHVVLKERLGRRFHDERVLDLMHRIIDSHGGGVPGSGVRFFEIGGRTAFSTDQAFTPPIPKNQTPDPSGFGLPIGSLTSQHFANYYLGWFDRFVKETLRVKGYVRYMDDFVLWSKSKDELREHRSRCVEFLSQELHLEVKKPRRIRFSDTGLSFLGCHVWRTHLTLNDRSRRRFRKQLESLETQYLNGLITELELQQRATAMIAFTQAGDVRSWRFRTQVLQDLAVSGQGPRTG